MICVVDYGLGNIQAFLNVYRMLNVDAKRATTASELEGATHLILPGVGSFDLAMQLFNESSMRSTVEQLVMGAQLPLLGVCVGMQMLATSSEEGSEPGLNWIPGIVKKMSSALVGDPMQLPHMGWNDSIVVRPDQLFCTQGESDEFYFLHSYCYEPANENDISSVFEYGNKMTSAVSRMNIFGVQFHPEKSHNNGISLLKRFSEIQCVPIHA